MTERSKRLSRRNFLLAASAGSVATAAAIVATKSPSTTKPAPATNDKRATRGYQSSEHVNNYYRTAKV